MFFYSTDTVSGKNSGPFDPSKYSGAKMYARHFSNLLYLDFIYGNKLSSFTEKNQAEREMVIARKKMKYWNSVALRQGEKVLMQTLVEQAKKDWNK